MNEDEKRKKLIQNSSTRKMCGVSDVIVGSRIEEL